ncbi:MAG: hypothetical protein IPN23_00030 [Elusimicrobia bacterium]|nr:hypothetical protein [Elusimicrobiota bacterium]
MEDPVQPAQGGVIEIADVAGVHDPAERRQIVARANREVVQRVDLVPLGLQVEGQVGADQAARAGDQKTFFHREEFYKGN